MAIVLPTLIGSGQTAAGGTTVSLGVETSVPTGSAVFICGGTNATALPVSITDTQGNSYFPVISSGSGLSAYVFACLKCNALTAAQDTVTATYAATAAAKNICGLSSASVNSLDQTASNRGTSTNPSVTTPQLNNPNELVIAVETNGLAGGALTNPGNFTEIITMNAQPFTSVLAQVISGTSPVTASGTIVSAPWTFSAASFYFQANSSAGIFPVLAGLR
jgi:hypothetical protein